MTEMRAALPFAFPPCFQPPRGCTGSNSIFLYTANILNPSCRSGFPLGLWEPQTAKLLWGLHQTAEWHPFSCHNLPVTLGDPRRAWQGGRTGELHRCLGSGGAQPRLAELSGHHRDAGDVTSRVSPCPARQARKRAAFGEKQASILIRPRASVRAAAHVSSPSHPAPARSLITQQNGMTWVPSWRRLRGTALDRRARRR